ALCQWRLPASHYLESWGDAESADGTYSPVQPLIAPLFGGRSALELVARLIQFETTQPYEIVLRSFRRRVGAAADQTAFRTFLHEGFWPNSARNCPSRAGVGEARRGGGGLPTRSGRQRR